MNAVQSESRNGASRPPWITEATSPGCRRQTLGGRCANPVTHSSTEFNAPNTALGGTTSSSEWEIFDFEK